jgi:hypothetical protein
LSIKRKVEKLMEEHREQQRERRRGQRCEVCASWPVTRVFSDDELVTSTARRISLTSDLPESCTCGFRPEPVRIRLITNWRDTRAEHVYE